MPPAFGQNKIMATKIVFVAPDRLNVFDYIVFVILFILPYLDGGPLWPIFEFAPTITSAGTGLIGLGLGIIVFIHSFLNRYHVKRSIFLYLLLIICAYILVKFTNTVQSTGFINALTVFRSKFVTILTLTLILSHLSNMTNRRIEKLVRLILICLVPFAIFYFLQCFGFEIFGDTDLEYTMGGEKIERNIVGIPPIMPCIFALCFTGFLYDYGKIMIFLTALCTAVIFISFTRSWMGVLVMIVLVSTLLYTLRVGTRKLASIWIAIVAIIAVFFVVFPDGIVFWAELYDSVFGVERLTDVGTYGFRQSLIDTALEKLRATNDELLGFGYVRDVEKGLYSFVLGNDTLVPPILWCEGYVGLVLRIIPIAYLLISATVIFFKTRYFVAVAISACIISCILPQIVNWMQTDIYINYTFTPAMLYLMLCYIDNYMKKADDILHINGTAKK